MPRRIFVTPAFAVSVAAVVALLVLSAAPAQAKVFVSIGQTIYVPAYANIPLGKAGKPFALAVTLSVRNTSPDSPIIITGVDWYDSHGELLEKLQPQALSIAPLGSKEYRLTEQRAAGGGSGANFVVRWKAERAVTPPVVEALMVGATMGQGISFTSPGRVIEER